MAAWPAGVEGCQKPVERSPLFIALKEIQTLCTKLIEIHLSLELFYPWLESKGLICGII